MSAARARAARVASKGVLLDPAADEAIERFARVMAQCGYGAPAVRKSFEAAMASSAGRTKRGRAAQRLRELPDAPHLVTLWCSTPDYVDERGTPRRLPARGPGPSVESLARRVNRSFDLDELKPYQKRLAALGVPALILWGQKDEYLPFDYASRFAREIPGSKLVLLERARHFLFEDEPERCAQAVINFLAQAGI